MKPGEKLYQHGQWVGDSVDSNGIRTRVLVNVEKRTRNIAQVWSHNPEFPELRTLASFIFEPEQTTIIVDPSETVFFNPSTKQFEPATKVWKEHGIETPFPTKNTLTITESGRILSGTYATDIGIKGTFKFVNTMHDPPQAPDEILSWKKFKDFVLTNFLKNERVFFRGQSNNQWKLQTIWHRAGRNNLWRYWSEDVPLLRHAINALGDFYYREDDAELGALLSVAQHHGYPTPLLDWSLSPYIAAFFAFIEEPASNAPEAARIFIFDSSEWRCHSSGVIYDPMPGMSFHRFPAHNNPRFMPQQSMASFCNIDDIEGFIIETQQVEKAKHLTIIDIPFSERRHVLDELRLMGITSASLFPGLDGVCRSLKQRYFSD